MPPPPSFWFPGPGIDIIASAFIVFASFLIFFKTREFYRLSSHEGIRFFRYAFLFFGITFLVQLLRPLFHEIAEIAPRSFRPLSLLLVVYAGSVAILCLLYSVLWRRVPLRIPFLMINLLAVLLALITWVARAPPLILALQILLFMVVLLFSYLEAKETRSKALQVHVLYTLLFFSWIASLAASFTEWRLFVLSALLNAVSVTLFSVLLYKVLRRTVRT